MMLRGLISALALYSFQHTAFLSEGKETSQPAGDTWQPKYCVCFQQLMQYVCHLAGLAHASVLLTCSSKDNHDHDLMAWRSEQAQAYEVAEI